MSTYSLINGSHDLNGKMKAIVLTNEDPKNLGRIGVYIPRVMGLIPNASEKEESKDSIDKEVESKYKKDMDITGKKMLDSVNYILARPFMYGYNKDGVSGGEWKIPPVGARVIVEFIDANPQELYYYPFAPYDEEVGFEFDPYETEGTGTVSIEVLYKSLKRNIVLFDSTDDKDIFVIKMKSGMTFQMDAKNNVIELYTNDDETNVRIDNAEVTVTTKNGNVNVNTDGGSITTNTSSGAISAISDSGDITLKTSTGKIHLGTCDSLLWAPNIMTNCPLLTVPHGGIAAGINNLDGKAL